MTCSGRPNPPFYRRPFPLAGSCQPGLVPPQGLSRGSRFGFGQRALAGEAQQFRALARRRGLGRRPEDRQPMRVVLVADFRHILDAPLRFQAGGRDVLALGPVAEPADGFSGRSAGLECLLLVLENFKNKERGWRRVPPEAMPEFLFRLGFESMPSYGRSGLKLRPCLSRRGCKA